MFRLRYSKIQLFLCECQGQSIAWNRFFRPHAAASSLLQVRKIFLSSFPEFRVNSTFNRCNHLRVIRTPHEITVALFKTLSRFVFGSLHWTFLNAERADLEPYRTRLDQLKNVVSIAIQILSMVKQPILFQKHQK